MINPGRNPNADPQRWRIPEGYRSSFTSSPGLKALRAYRSFFDHDADFNRGDDDKFDRHQSIGKAFTDAIGRVRPENSEEWARAHAHLLGGLADAAEGLLEAYRHDEPARDGVSAGK